MSKKLVNHVRFGGIEGGGWVADILGRQEDTFAEGTQKDAGIDESRCGFEAKTSELLKAIGDNAQLWELLCGEFETSGCFEVSATRKTLLCGE